MIPLLVIGTAVALLLATSLTPTRVFHDGVALWVRPLSSDQWAIHEVFDQDTYGLARMVLPPSPVIVDIGANIGAFSVRCAMLWPGARIIAVEMQPDSARLARMSLSQFPQTTVEEAAARGSRIPTGYTCRTWMYGECQTTFAVGQSIRALTLKELLALHRIDTVDLLKIDAEGAEHDVLRLAEEDGTLAKVRRIVGEWHEREDGSRVSVTATLVRAGFTVETTDTGAGFGGIAAWREP